MAVPGSHDYIFERIWYHIKRTLHSIHIIVSCSSRSQDEADRNRGTFSEVVKSLSQILKDVVKEPSVPIIIPENLEEVMTSGNLPSQFKKAQMVQDSPNNLFLDNRKNVAQATASRGFAVAKEVQAVQPVSKAKMRYPKISFKISHSMDKLPEESPEDMSNSS